MRVRVLGRLKLWRHGQRVAMGSGRQRAVFTLLLLAGGPPVVRGELMAALGKPSGKRDQHHPNAANVRRPQTREPLACSAAACVALPTEAR